MNIYKKVEFCYRCIINDGLDLIKFDYDNLIANFTNESELPSIKPLPYFEEIKKENEEIGEV
mgnify:CR=1 FL=1